MIFEVFDQKGRRMMWSESPACFLPPEMQKSLRLAGYTIKIDGKIKKD